MPAWWLNEAEKQKQLTLRWRSLLDKLQASQSRNAEEWSRRLTEQILAPFQRGEWPRTSDPVGPPLAIRRWRQQALAIVEWVYWRQNFCKGSSDNRAFDELSTISQRLGKLAYELVDGKRRWRASRWLETHEFSRMTEGVLHLLRGFQNSIDLLKDRAAEQGGALAYSAFDQHIRNVDHFLQVDAAWPPWRLARLALAARKFGAASSVEFLAGDLESLLPPPAAADAAIMEIATAECHLVVAVVARVDEIVGGDQELFQQARRELEQFCSQLLGGLNMRVELVRDAKSCWTKTKPVGHARVPAVVETGIVLLPGLSGSTRDMEPLVLREALAKVPESLSPLVALLERAGRALFACDSALARLCRDLAAELRQGPSLRAWLDRAEGEPGALARSILVWRVLQRIRLLEAAQAGQPAPDASIAQLLAALLAEFAEEGATFLTEPPLGQLESPPGRSRLWLVGRSEAVAAKNSTPLSVRRNDGVWVQLPDSAQTLLAPAAFAIVRQTDASSPWQNFCCDQEGLFAEIMHLDPQPDFWNEVNLACLGGLCETEAEAAVNSSGLAQVMHMLTLFYRRWKLADSRLKPLYGLAVRNMAAFVENDLHAELVPRLDLATLAVRLEKRQIPRGSRVTHAASPDVPSATILDVQAFGAGEIPCSIVVSGGCDVPAELVDWYRLPPLSQDGAAGGLTRRLQDELQSCGAALADAVEALRKGKRRLRDWLSAPDGETWLNRFIVKIRNLADPQAAPEFAWWKYWTGHDWFAVCPVFEADGNRVCWPSGVTTLAPGATWRFAADRPIGDALDGDIRFAVDPCRVQGIFSLGDPAASELARKSDGLFNLQAGLLAASPQLAEPVGRLAALARDAALAAARNCDAATFAEPADVALQSLEALEAARQLDNETRQQVLVELQSSLADWKLRVLPENWSYLEPAADKQAEPVFDETLAVGEVGCRFGLEGSGARLREPRTVVCVGEPPPGYRELRAAVERTPPEARAAMNERLARWPNAARRHDLLNSVVALFMQWYDSFAEPVAAAEPGVAAALRDAFHKLFAAMKCTIFEPERGKRVENPGKYLDIIEHRKVSDPAARSGTVLEVKRPAILDARSEPLCRARVVLCEAAR